MCHLDCSPPQRNEGAINEEEEGEKKGKNGGKEKIILYLEVSFYIK